MNKNKVRLLFVLLVGFLFFQFFLCIKFSEPYPAIVLPGFGKIPQSSNNIKYVKYEILAFSSEQNYDYVSADELFMNVPRVFVPVMLNNIIKKHNKETDNSNQKDYVKFKRWIATRLNSIYKKDYFKVEIRKLEVTTNPQLNDVVLEKVSLKNQTSIVL